MTQAEINDGTGTTGRRMTPKLLRDNFYTEDEIDAMIAGIGSIPVDTTQPSGGMLPNVFYNLGTLSGSITFTIAAPEDADIVNHYYWTFDTGSTAPTIIWPSGISWYGGSAPTISASKHYEVSIIDNIAICMEV